MDPSAPPTDIAPRHFEHGVPGADRGQLHTVNELTKPRGKPVMTAKTRAPVRCCSADIRNETESALDAGPAN